MESEWYKLKSINGSQGNAFEELICQMASNEIHPNFRTFQRVGAPDGGVECYWELHDNSKWGWQAKFYQKFESAEWHQIKYSLNTAMYKHPTLKKYIVAITHNLSDGVHQKNSQKKLWEKYRKEWITDWRTKGRELELVLWDSSYLFSNILQSKNSGLYEFFFKEIIVDESHLYKMTNVAIANLGPRHSRNLDIKMDYLINPFDAISRNIRFKEYFSRKLDKLLVGLNDILIECEDYPETSTIRNFLESKYEEIVSIHNDTDFTSQAALPILSYKEKVSATLSVLELKKPFSDSEEQLSHAFKFPLSEEKKETLNYKLNTRQSEKIAEYRKLAEQWFHYIDGAEIRTAQEGILLLDGQPGMGKSHLLADIALERASRNIPCIFMLGVHFKTSPRYYIQQALCPALPFEQYLRALNVLAKSKQERILFMIDAINEGDIKHEWKQSLAGLAEEFNSFKWIGLIVSYRTTYKELVIPSHFNPPIISHYGFKGYEFFAFKQFFKYYKIVQPSIPLLNPEFSNPLFLKIFCDTLSKKSRYVTPTKSVAFSTIFNEYINVANERIGERLHYSFSKINIIQDAISILVRFQIREGRNIIPWKEAYQMLEPILQTYTTFKGLLEEMIREGLLIEEAIYNHETRNVDQVGVTFSFEKIGEYHKCIFYLSYYENVDGLFEAFQKDGPLRKIFMSNSRFSDEYTGLLEAFSVVIPEKYEIELYELLSFEDPKGKKAVYDAFLKSLFWRKNKSVKASSILFLEANFESNTDMKLKWINTLLLLAVNGDHCFNADFIHNKLINLSLPELDSAWSIPIVKVCSTSENSVQRIIYWCCSIEDKSHISDEAMLLLGKSIAWLLGSPDKSIRDKATHAFSSLFINRIALLVPLLKDFKNVNDPYIMERILAGALGALTHTISNNAKKDLAKYVYEIIFGTITPTLNIMIRDYAKGIVEHVDSTGQLLGYPPERFHSPISSFPYEEVDYSFLYSYDKVSAIDLSENEIGRLLIFKSSLQHGPSSPIKSYFSIPFTKYSIRSRIAFEELYSQLTNGDIVLINKLINLYIEDDEADFPSNRNNFYSALETGRELFQRLQPAQKLLFKEAESYIKYRLPIKNDYKRRFDDVNAKYYIVRRVFELGWTTDYFGEYDAAFRGQYTQTVQPGRVGEKYQRIAFYEFLARLSGSFDFYSDMAPLAGRVLYSENWYSSIRDIDPTNLLGSGLSERNIDNIQDRKWWKPFKDLNWDIPLDTWLSSLDDIPLTNELVKNIDESEQEWYVLRNQFILRSPKSIGKRSYFTGRRELKVDLACFLIEKSIKDELWRAAEKGNFELEDLIISPKQSDIFLGELYYSEQYRKLMKDFYHEEPFIQIDLSGVTFKLIHTTDEYMYSNRNYTSEDAEKIYKPSKFLLELIQGVSGANDACIYQQDGSIIALDAGKYHSDSTNNFFVSKKVLDQKLKDSKYEMIWLISGDKFDIGPKAAYTNQIKFAGIGAFIINEFRTALSQTRPFKN